MLEYDIWTNLILKDVLVYACVKRPLKEWISDVSIQWELYSYSAILNNLEKKLIQELIYIVFEIK